MSDERIEAGARDAEAGPRFTVAEASLEPIYMQLASQVKRHVASGMLAPGDELPSVRRLANDLGVSKMTISKAFQLLESQGCLVRRRGTPSETTNGLPLEGPTDALDYLARTACAD